MSLLFCCLTNRLKQNYKCASGLKASNCWLIVSKRNVGDRLLHPPSLAAADELASCETN